MGGKSGGGGAPSPSEYMPLVEQQARLNRVNTYTPYGSTTYRQIGGTPTTQQPAGMAAGTWTAGGGELPSDIKIINGVPSRFDVGGEGIGWKPIDQAELAAMNIYRQPGQEQAPGMGGGQWEQISTYSPEVQNIFNQQLAAALNPDQFNETVANATYQRAMNLLNPTYEQQQRKFEQQMANRGLVSGGEAYDTAYRNVMDAQNRARENAALAAVLQGQNAAQQAYGRMAGITGMGGQAPGVPGIDVTSPYQIAQQARQTDAAQAAQQKQSNTQGAAALGTMAMMMCDENIKTDKTPIDYQDILDGFDKVNIERWKYIGENREHIGPYAQEFKEAFGIGSGMDISPIDAIGVLMAANKALLERVKVLEARHG